MNALARRFGECGLSPITSLADDFLDTFVSGPLFRPSNHLQVGKFDVNVCEKDNAWIVEASVPGIDKEAINIDIDNDVLEISFEQKTDKCDEKTNYVVKEFAYGKQSRAFRLPNGVDIDNPDATLKDGVLTLTFAKTKSNKIKIK